MSTVIDLYVTVCTLMGLNPNCTQHLPLLFSVLYVELLVPLLGRVKCYDSREVDHPQKLVIWHGYCS